MDNNNQPQPQQPTAAPPAASSDPRELTIEKLKQANNVLVTVSNSPSVDQLAACIGLTLILTKMGKHATAVFSGEIPSTIEFLQPEATIETTTDSLQDFIISLDKAKADKLRYKVEDKVVKIFITPYRSPISEKDLEFSQGDLNVDAIVALGVKKQEDLDKAITAHGRILHDATVLVFNNSGEQSSLGTVNWQDVSRSSLSEMVTDLSANLGENLLDTQIANALLTGIVAATDRFSNEKTKPVTMTVSARLLAAGANQQLVAEKLGPQEIPEEAPVPINVKPTKPAKPPKPTVPEPPTTPDDGALSVDHDKDKPLPDTSAEALSQIHIDNQGMLQREGDNGSDGNQATGPAPTPFVNIEQPDKPEDELSLPEPVNKTESTPTVTEDVPPNPVSPPTPIEPAKMQSETLAQLEQDVNAHGDMVQPGPGPSPVASNPIDIDAVRNTANMEAQSLQPNQDLNALPLGPDLHTTAPAQPAVLPSLAPEGPVVNEVTPLNNEEAPGQSMDMPLPPNLITPQLTPPSPPTSTDVSPTPPPPLPPPFPVQPPQPPA